MRSHSGTNRNPTIDIDREIAQQGIPSSCHNTYRKAHTGSRPAAIKAMCLMCQGWDDGARKAVRDCADVGCPLWSVRPFQSKGPGADTEDIDGENGIDSDTENETETDTERVQRNQTLILNALTTEWAGKKEIIAASGIDDRDWNETVKELMSQGLIEREGERRFTRYRRVQS